jgi:hypothetical protein
MAAQRICGRWLSAQPYLIRVYGLFTVFIDHNTYAGIILRGGPVVPLHSLFSPLTTPTTDAGIILRSVFRVSPSTVFFSLHHHLIHHLPTPNIQRPLSIPRIDKYYNASIPKHRRVYLLGKGSYRAKQKKQNYRFRTETKIFLIGPRYAIIYLKFGMIILSSLRTICRYLFNSPQLGSMV